MELRDKMLLYAVTDRHWLGRESLYEQVEKALKGGVTFVQLREKDMPFEEICEEAKQIKELCSRYNVPFIINDNVDIAQKTDADGVHVGQDDMDVKQVRKILGPDKIIGVSAHNPEEAVRAWRDGADYLGSGAVFATGTKSDVSCLEHETLKEICESVDIPVVAIGGITYDNVGKLKGTGISGVAVVSAVFAADDIENETKKLKEKVKSIL